MICFNRIFWSAEARNRLILRLSYLPIQGQAFCPRWQQSEAVVITRKSQETHNHHHCVQIFRFATSKNASLFLQRKNPRKIAWTVVYRRMHKKGLAEEVAKKRSRKTVKHQRGIVGADLAAIAAKRNQTTAIRQQQRLAAITKAKSEKKDKETKKDKEKVSTKVRCDIPLRILVADITFLEGSTSNSRTQGIETANEGHQGSGNRRQKILNGPPLYTYFSTLPCNVVSHAFIDSFASDKKL